jgi:hypothetical protein
VLFFIDSTCGGTVTLHAAVIRAEIRKSQKKLLNIPVRRHGLIVYTHSRGQSLENKNFEDQSEEKFLTEIMKTDYGELIGLNCFVVGSSGQMLL